MAARLDAFLAAKGPALLEVVADIEEVLYPVVRPGDSYADMVLGPYIGKKEPNT